MTEARPAIPARLRRLVLVEAGHRCAIPTCRQTPVDVHHIVPWATVQEHAFENLIALCPNDHRRAERGEIDRQSMLTYKRNLAVLNSRYGEMERRLLDMFAHADPSVRTMTFLHPMDFEFMYLIRDGLVTSHRQDSGVYTGNIPLGAMYHYVLTPEGREFLARWETGQPIEEDPGPPE